MEYKGSVYDKRQRTTVRHKQWQWDWKIWFILNTIKKTSSKPVFFLVVWFETTWNRLQYHIIITWMFYLVYIGTYRYDMNDDKRKRGENILLLNIVVVSYILSYTWLDTTQPQGVLLTQLIALFPALLFGLSFHTFCVRTIIKSLLFTFISFQ